MYRMILCPNMIGNTIARRILRFRLHKKLYCTNVPNPLNSPLYVLTEKLSDNESIIIPDINIKAACENPAIRKSLQMRQWKTEFDFINLKKEAEYLEWIECEKERIEGSQAEKKSKHRDLAEAGENTNDVEEQMSALKKEIREGKKDLKDLSSSKAKLEKSAIFSFLALPNILEPDCPTSDDEIVKTFRTAPRFKFQPKCHTELAAKELEMSQNSQNAVYLFGRLAKLELELTKRFQTHLLEKEFSMVSCPDFTKSLVIDGCGESFVDRNSEFALKPAQEFKDPVTGQGMHLVGGSSIYPFVAFFSKNILRSPDPLPLSMFTVGRRYRPTVALAKEESLLTAQQTSSVQCFKVGCHPETGRDEFEALLEAVLEYYRKIGIHHRAVARSADKLKASESYRVAIEMFSPFRENYIEVGHVSMYTDYLSKRMMLKVEEGKDNLINLQVCGGQAMDVFKVIACVVECAQTNLGEFKL